MNCFPLKSLLKVAARRVKRPAKQRHWSLRSDLVSGGQSG